MQFQLTLHSLYVMVQSLWFPVIAWMCEYLTWESHTLEGESLYWDRAKVDIFHIQID